MGTVRESAIKAGSTCTEGRVGGDRPGHRCAGPKRHARGHRLDLAQAESAVPAWGYQIAEGSSRLDDWHESVRRAAVVAVRRTAEAD